MIPCWAAGVGVRVASLAGCPAVNELAQAPKRRVNSLKFTCWTHSQAIKHTLSLANSRQLVYGGLWRFWRFEKDPAKPQQNAPSHAVVRVHNPLSITSSHETCLNCTTTPNNATSAQQIIR